MTGMNFRPISGPFDLVTANEKPKMSSHTGFAECLANDMNFVI